MSKENIVNLIFIFVCILINLIQLYLVFAITDYFGNLIHLIPINVSFWYIRDELGGSKHYGVIKCSLYTLMMFVVFNIILLFTYYSLVTSLLLGCLTAFITNYLKFKEEQK